MVEEVKNVFILGIKGVAMANLAVILKKMGKNVTGSDVDEEFITDELLNKNSIGWSIGFDPQNIPQETDLLVYSAAHNGKNNPQVQYALEKGIKVLNQADLLSEIMNLHENKIAVCGSHGKTTTTALIAFCLKKLGVNPTYMVGTSYFSGQEGGNLGDKKYCVIEADEYGVDPPNDKTPKFQKLEPNYIVSTNIDFDHPDIFSSIEETKSAFYLFFQKLVNIDERRLFLCADDQKLMGVASQLQMITYKTFGFSEKADFVIKNIQTDETHCQFELYEGDKKVDEFTLLIFGEKNISNAAGAIVLLLNLGFSSEAIKNVISLFTGAKRRFEQTAFVNNIYLFDDYAHHPQEIEATLNAARLRFNNRRIILVFQPHTYSRTESLKEEFVKSLAKADLSLIAPIFASARETLGLNLISSSKLAEMASQRGVSTIFSYSTKAELIDRLKSDLRPGDVIFTMGAGDIYKVKNDIISLIRTV
ncbi:MAG: UDP-N-acetylmuramate--L-alanine ligase [Candidatus Roizmanbacteria bacterium]|nr:MAG: UDP-N-acetylmuramate--L-alanine ligase [Candidatus Roizmanbacteria bacterium]